jgi:hypothetical protein
MRVIVGAMVVVLLGSGMALAQSRPPPSLEQQTDEAARAMRDALEKAMRVLDGVLGSIPQYEVPEVLPNGDIIIRRIPQAQRPPQRAPAPPPAPKKSPTDPKLEET